MRETVSQATIGRWRSVLTRPASGTIELRTEWRFGTELTVYPIGTSPRKDIYTLLPLLF
jgi:hypothetical protein